VAAISTSPDEKSLGICPACGYPTLAKGLCAFCIPIAASRIDLVFDAFGGASDVNPAA
jgi:hypothetical protein